MNRSIETITMTIFVLAAGGCELGATVGDGEPALEEALFAADNGIELDNGLTLANGAVLPNGTKLSNGLKLSNGIDAANGIQLSNGTKLSNGITGPYYAPPSGSALEQWIDVDPPMRKRILRYLIECALPWDAEVQLLYHGQLEVLGRGVGNLGPGLAGGQMTTDEEQKVSACLLARVNARGEVVTIDMYGPMGDGLFDTSVSDPAATPEGVFFGNLFASSPSAFVCSTEGSIASLDRSCVGFDCGVMSYIGSCDPVYKLGKVAYGCALWRDGYYLGCAVGGTVWKWSMTTYVGGLGGEI